jgi:hypothetical protein
VFQVGSPSNRFDQADFELTLTGDDITADHTVEGVGMQIQNNDGFLMVDGGGQLQFFGDQKLSFTKLSATVNPGANQIRVADQIDRNFDGSIDAADGSFDWEVGDQVVIASSKEDYRQEEVRTISGIANLGNGEWQLTLNAALNNRHFGEIETYSNDSRSWDVDMRAEVARLNRNIRVQGLAVHDTDNFFGDRARFTAGTGDGIGGHVMIMPTAGQIALDSVQFDRLGQTAQLGRYPVHWHLGGDRSGDMLISSSVTNSNNRGVTIHGTHNVLLQDNVLHDIHGHGFFMEDAVETGNQYISNITLGIHKVGRSGNSIDLDDPFIVDTHDHVGQNRTRFLSSAGYWMTNPDNIWMGNVSAGSEGTGFWFLFPRTAIGLSADDSQYDNVRPWTVDLGTFDYNSSHSSPIGLNFDRGSDLEVPVGGTLKANFDGLEHRPSSEPQINFFTGYQHTTGIYHRGRTANFHGNKLVDNFTSTFITFTQRITDTLYVGHSRGNSDPGEIVTGHTFYDGANTLTGTHFAGFTAANSHMFRAEAAAQRLTHFVMNDMSFEDDGSANNVSYSTANGGQNYGSVGKTMPSIIFDADGSFTSHVGGQAGSTIVPNHPFFYNSDDFLPSGWNARVSDDLYAMFRMKAIANDENPLFEVTSPGGHSGQARPGTGQFSGTNTLMKLDDGDYTVTFPEGLSSIDGGFEIRHHVRVGPTLGATVVRFPGVADWVTVENTPRVRNLAALRLASATSFVTVGDDIWVKFFESNDSVRFVRGSNEPLDNTAPIAVDDQISTNEDTAISISVLANDTDAENDILTLLGSHVVADYVDDFRSETFPENWQYLWNPEDVALGDQTNYQAMQWDNWRYKPTSTDFPYAGPTYAHPGDGTSESSDGNQRYSIAAFTIPADGIYSINDSLIDTNTSGDGVNIQWHTAGGPVNSLGQFPSNFVGNFDSEIGFLQAGQTLYVGVGANSGKGNDGIAWDFSIQWQAIAGHGQLDFYADDTVTYDPADNFHGQDNFGYFVADGVGGFDFANVIVNVNSVPDGTVAGSYVYYAGSGFSASSPRDAIAPNKEPLLPGQTADFRHFTNYRQGITGLLLDTVDWLGEPTLTDFEFHVGNDNNVADWDELTVQPTLEYTLDAGANQSDQLTLRWSDQTIVNQWLQVTVKANGNADLVEDYVFYFGNQVGDVTGDGVVDSADVLGVRANRSSPFNLPGIESVYDLNRDNEVAGLDVLIARQSRTSPFSFLRLISVPGGSGMGFAALSGGGSESSGSSEGNRVRRISNGFIVTKMPPMTESDNDLQALATVDLRTIRDSDPITFRNEKLAAKPELEQLEFSTLWQEETPDRGKNALIDLSFQDQIQSRQAKDATDSPAIDQTFSFFEDSLDQILV